MSLALGLLQSMLHDLPHPLCYLAAAYERRLATGDVNLRLAHHTCHFASEQWLAQELAYLVNTEAGSFGMDGWHALLERKRVDVTLQPPAAIDRPIHLELKQVTPAYWSNWHEVYHDLGCHPDHPARKGRSEADYAICYLIYGANAGAIRSREATALKYRRLIEGVPTSQGMFTPVDGMPSLRLRHTSEPICLDWRRAPADTWPEGYRANLRILWVSAT